MSVANRDAPLDVDRFTDAEVTWLVRLYAPRRELFWGDSPMDTIDMNLTIGAEDFIEFTQYSYARLADALVAHGDNPTGFTLYRFGDDEFVAHGENPAGNPDQTLDKLESSLIKAMKEEWLPSGPIFLECLKLGRILNVPPYQVFRHVALGEGIVPQPWEILKSEVRVRKTDPPVLTSDLTGVSRLHAAHFQSGERFGIGSEPGHASVLKGSA